MWLGGLNLSVRRRSSPPGCIFELLEPAAASLRPSSVLCCKCFKPIAIIPAFPSIVDDASVDKNPIVDRYYDWIHLSIDIDCPAKSAILPFFRRRFMIAFGFFVDPRRSRSPFSRSLPSVSVMPYSERFEQALILANRLHANQFRKGTTVPYLTHLLAVAAIVGENGGSEDQMIAALLHDAPEDQGGHETLELIRTQFGETVARIVAGCSDTFESPKPPWKARKNAYIHHLKTVIDQEALPVVLADKLHNARSIVDDLKVHGPRTLDRFTGGIEGTVWYYRAVAAVLTELLDSPAVERLNEIVNEMERLSGIVKDRTNQDAIKFGDLDRDETGR